MRFHEAAIRDQHAHQDAALQREVTGDVPSGPPRRAVRILIKEFNEEVEVRVLLGVSPGTGAEKGDPKARGVALPGEAPRELAGEGDCIPRLQGRRGSHVSQLTGSI